MLLIQHVFFLCLSFARNFSVLIRRFTCLFYSVVFSFIWGNYQLRLYCCFTIFGSDRVRKHQDKRIWTIYFVHILFRLSNDIKNDEVTCDIVNASKNLCYVNKTSVLTQLFIRRFYVFHRIWMYHLMSVYCNWLCFCAEYDTFEAQFIYVRR